MYRILSASKDTYVTSKYINNVRSLNSNVGQAASIDLYSLYDETTITGITSSIREVSRGLIKFDYSEIQSMIDSNQINVGDPSFQCFVSMKDLYGGQTTPSNFDLILFPLSKSWDEGNGIDVIAYRDKDSCNFLTASIVDGNPVLWSLEGASATGTLGSSNVDIITSGNIGGIAREFLGRTQRFNRGDEDLFIDVTNIVTASLIRNFPNQGFRLSFTHEEEQAETTYFVKRFGTRHTNDKSYHPKLIVKYDDSIIDHSGIPLFNVSQSFFLYNRNQSSELANLTSGSSTVTGNNSLILELVASQSVSYTTSSWSVTHSSSISYLTKSLSYYSQSFVGSQHGNQTGIYSASFLLNSFEEPLKSWLSGNEQQSFKGSWKSLDGTIIYASKYFTFKNQYGNFQNVTNTNNYVFNITNLKNTYKHNSESRLRIFAQDYNTEQVATKVPTEIRSVIIPNILWSIKEAFTNKTIIPFDEVGTKVSTDSEGMYFDLYLSDLNTNIVYQIDLLINDNLLIQNEGFRFKIVS